MQQNYRSGNNRVYKEELMVWLEQKTKEKKVNWSISVIERISQGILAALRDFGILEGKRNKYIKSFHLPIETFAMISFCLNKMGYSGELLVKHPDWQLFLINNKSVEHLFLDCHQHGWLRFDMAGNIYRIEYSEKTFEEYVHAIFG